MLSLSSDSWDSPKNLLAEAITDLRSLYFMSNLVAWHLEVVSSLASVVRYDRPSGHSKGRFDDATPIAFIGWTSRRLTSCFFYYSQGKFSSANVDSSSCSFFGINGLCLSMQTINGSMVMSRGFLSLSSSLSFSRCCVEGSWWKISHAMKMRGLWSKCNTYCCAKDNCESNCELITIIIFLCYARPGDDNRGFNSFLRNASFS